MPCGFASLGARFGACGFTAPGDGAEEAFGSSFGAAGFDAGVGFAEPGVAGVAFCGALGAGFAAGFLSSAGFAPPSASNAARSLRATGGSIVDDGLFTNSPISLSFARAVLLSTPISAAISCTRGLATILLSGRVCPGRADL